MDCHCVHLTLSPCDSETMGSTKYWYNGFVVGVGGSLDGGGDKLVEQSTMAWLT